MIKKIAVAALVAFAIPMTSQAQLVPASPACAASILFPTYTACWGSFGGNNTGVSTSSVEAYLNLKGYGTWTETGTTNAGQSVGPFISVPGDPSGTVEFLTAQNSPFVVALKAGNQFSLYYFGGSPSAFPISSFTYTTNGVNVNNESPAGLSHATLYNVTPCEGECGPDITTVPEPSTYALMASGLLGIFGVARRRRRSA